MKPRDQALTPSLPIPLSELVALARRSSRFYRELYANLPENITSLSELPVLDQEAFWKANRMQENQILTGAMKNGIVFKSGGTTGNPKFSVFAKAEWKLFNEVFGRSLAKGILAPEDRVANFFYSGQLYGSLLFISKSLDECPTGVLELPIGGSNDFQETFEVIRDFKVTVLAGVPTSILNLADFIRQKGNPEKLSVKKILFGGEAMYADQRESLAEVFPGVQVHSIGYASTDAGLIGYADLSCGPSEHRAFGTHTFLEVVDEETHAVIDQPGVEGILVLTNLIRGLMPIIRYPVGDRGSWVEASGTPDRKYALLGRSEEAARIGLVKLYVDDVRTILSGFKDELKISDFQMIVLHHDRRDGLVLRIAVSSDPRSFDPKRIVDKIHQCRPLYEEFVDERKIHPIKIEWAKPGGLETNPRTGKLKKVIDRRLARASV